MATSPYGNLYNLRMHQPGMGGFGGFGQQPMLPQHGPTANPIFGHPGGGFGGGFGGMRPVQPIVPPYGAGGFGGAPTLPGGAFPSPVGPQPIMPPPGMNPGGPMLPNGGGYPQPVGPQPVMPPHGFGGFGMGGAPSMPGGGMNLNNLLMLQRMGMNR